MVERAAVNRDVVGSSPTSGAIWFEEAMYWVYVLQNPCGKFYIGQTDNLSARLYSHNRTDKTDGKFTRKNGPWNLVWSEEHPTRSSAMARERQIKGMKSARWIREQLFNGRVPLVGINRDVVGSSPTSGAIFNRVCGKELREEEWPLSVNWRAQLQFARI
jgi:putative endonuclease